MECPICYENTDEYEMIGHDQCDHRYCGRCIFEHVKAKISDGETKITCPDSYCDEYIPHETIISIIYEDDDVNKRYRQNNALLDNNHCICIECDEVVKKSDDTNKVFCQYCDIYFCAICKGTHYDYDDCSNEDEINDNLAEIQNILKTDNIKFCPICKIIIYKDGGCNSVKCDKCNIKFCWKCLKTNKQITDMSESHDCGDYGVFTTDDGIDGY